LLKIRATGGAFFMKTIVTNEQKLSEIINAFFHDNLMRRVADILAAYQQRKVIDFKYHFQI
jgi:hypothetical protein